MKSKNKKRKLIIGLGTGRTGSCSLRAFLDGQPLTRCTHEARPIPWIATNGWFSQSREVLLHNYQDIKKEAKSDNVIIGDVGHYHLPYVERYLSFFDVKFLCLVRPKEEVIASFIGHTDRHQQSHNYWSKSGDGIKDSYVAFTRGVVALWNPTFPKYDGKDRAECLGKYWEDYYSCAAGWQSKIPDRFKIFRSDALKHVEGQKDMLRFLGYTKGKIYPSGVVVKNHQGAERRVAPDKFDLVTL